MSEYEPGTIAVVTAEVKGEVRTERAWLNGDDMCWYFADGDGFHSSRADLIRSVRPLVVLDIKAANPIGYPDAAVSNILACLRGQAGPTRACHGLADQIEAQTRPLKPPEPQGLGAVVEDAEGRQWVRKGRTAHGEDWSHQIGDAWTGNSWDRIAAVRILSEGVQ